MTRPAQQPPGAGRRPPDAAVVRDHGRPRGHPGAPHRRADLGHGLLGAHRVLPPVRVLAAIAGDQMDVIGERQLRRVAPRALDELVEPLVDVAAGADDQVGVRERLGVAGTRLVLVRVGVRGEDLGDVGTLAGDVADEVGGLGGGDDDLGPSAAAAVARAAAGERRRDSEQRATDKESENRSQQGRATR